MTSKQVVYSRVEVPETSWFGNFLVALNYVWTDTKKNKKSFLIGCFAITLVVFATTLLQNTIQSSPLIFLKLAENTLGEYDLTLWPATLESKQPTFTVNRTDVNNKIKDVPGVAGVFSRWILVSTVLNKNNPLKNGSGIILGMDSAAEQGIVGREWNHKPLNGSSAHVSSSLLRMLGVKPNNNEKITLTFDFVVLVSSLQGTQTEEELVQSITATIRKFVYFKNGETTLTFDIDLMVKYLEQLGVEITQQMKQILNVLKTSALQSQLSRIVLNWLATQGIGPDVIFEDRDLTPNEVKKIESILSITVDVTVEDEIPNPSGKFPEALGSVMVVELDFLNTFFRETLHRILNTVLDQAVEGVPLSSLIGAPVKNLHDRIDRVDSREYSMMLVVSYVDRIYAFTQNREKMDDVLNVWANNIGNALGIGYPATVQIPLVKTLQVLYYLRLFLDQLLTVVEIFLMAVGMYLIYALLIADVESRVYEMGMLRALGMEKYTLTEIVILQSILFSLPGISLGLSFALLAFQPIAYLLQSYTSTSVSFGLDPIAILMGVALGTIMPLASVIGPIKRALSKNLRDALDLYHSMTNDVKVTFTYLQDLGVSPEQTSISILAVLFGFLVYYLVPYSFVYLYLALFFNIFVAIIMGMILGLAILGMVFHPILSRVCVHLMVWGPDRRILKPVVLKNLSGHSRRNSKTAMMYTICMAFLLFSGTVFRHQMDTLIAGVADSTGADITIQSFVAHAPLNWQPMREWLKQEMNRPGTVLQDFSFVTWPINEYAYVRDDVKLSTLAEWPAINIWLMGVEYNYLDVSFDQYLGLSEINQKYPYNKTRHGNPDVVKSMWDYPSKGTIEVPDQILSSENGKELQDLDKTIYAEPFDVIISESTRTVLSCDVNSELDIGLWVAYGLHDTDKLWYPYHHLVRVRAMAYKFPGFIFSSYPPQAAARPIVLTSMAQYEHLMHKNFQRSYQKQFNSSMPQEAPRRACFIRVSEDATTEQREEIINSLRTWIRDSRILITDMKFLAESMDVAIYVLDLFNNLIAAIIITLCFFMLLVSFTANITENAWEFGVLRALGMTVNQVLRLYIYEALALVMASVFLGLLIGNFVSVTLTSEADLFTELPFTFSFPSTLFTTVFSLSILVAILGSYLPARVLLNKRIASALKNV